jgi:hypothetical protein
MARRQPAPGKRHELAVSDRGRAAAGQERHMGRLLAESRSVTTPYLLSTLVAKRAELAGVIAELERRLAQHRADLTHIDLCAGVLHVS